MNQPQYQILPVPTAPTMRHLDDYLAEIKPHKSPVTTDQYRLHLSRFFRFVLEIRATSYSRRLVKQFCLQMLQDGHTPKAVRQMESIVRIFYSWLHENEIIDANPLLGLRRSVQVSCRQPKEVFTAEEYERIKEAAQVFNYPEMRGACVIAWNTGLRMGDVCILQWDYVDLLAGVITLVPNKIRKIGRLIQIPIPPELNDFLIQRKAVYSSNPSPYVLPEMSMSYRHYANLVVGVQFARVLKKARVEGKSFHSFRRTFNTRAIQAGVSPAIVSQLTGQNIATVMKYVNIDLETKRQAVIQMNQMRKMNQL